MDAQPFLSELIAGSRFMYCHLAILVMMDESVKVLPKTNKGFEQDYWNY